MGVRGRVRRALREMAARVMSPPAVPRPMCYLGGHTALTKTIYGHKVYVDTRDRSIASHLLMDGFWEPWITDVFMRRLRPGATVVEVGANFGFYTLLAASIVGPGGRVVAFEANAETCRLLYASVEINGFLDRCQLVPRAVSDRCGSLTFYKATEHLGGSSVADPTVHFPEETVRAEVVEAVSLDAFLAGDPRPVDFLKIDAEGSEPAILRGARQLLRRSPDLEGIIEFSPTLIADAGEDAGGLARDLLAQGFTLQVIRPDGPVPVRTAEDALGHGHCEILLTRRPL